MTRVTRQRFPAAGTLLATVGVTGSTTFTSVTVSTSDARNWSG